MPTWATGTSTNNGAAVTPLRPVRPAFSPRPAARPASRGFTLLELLVVVLIIGITLGLVVPSLNPDRERGLDEESRRLVALIRLSAEEAVLQGREYAVELAPDGYRFLVLEGNKEGNKWLPLQDDLLHPRQLPEGLRLEVFFEGERFDFLRAEEEENPRLYILSSGEMTPLEILLSSADSERNYRIVIDINGKIRIEG